MVTRFHPRLITSPQVDLRIPLCIAPLGLFHPIVGSDFTRFTACHTVWRDHPPLRQDGHVEFFGEFDISDAAISASVSSITPSYNRQLILPNRTSIWDPTVGHTVRATRELVDDDWVYTLRHLYISNCSLQRQSLRQEFILVLISRTYIGHVDMHTALTFPIRSGA